MKLRLLVLALALLAACSQPGALGPKLPTATAAQAAACTARDGSWRCPKLAKPAPLFGAGPVQTPFTSWTVANWDIDPVSGNDANDCITSGTACKTYNEIYVHRWGCFGGPAACPRFQQTTAIVFTSSQSGNTDPVYLVASSEKNSTISIQGIPNTTTSTTITGLVTIKNHAAGSNQLLWVTFGSNPQPYQLVLNNTHPSSAWPYVNTSGNSWKMSQPLATVSSLPPASTSPAEVDSWTSASGGDSVTFYTLPQVNIVKVEGIVADGATGNGYIGLLDLDIYSPSGPGTDAAFIGDNVNLVQCIAHRNLNIVNRNLDTVNTTMVNLNAPSAVAIDTGANSVIFNGGISNSKLVAYGNVALDGDIILGGSGTFLSTGGDGMGSYLGFAYLDANLTLLGGGTQFASAYTASPVLYGNGSAVVNLTGMSRLFNGTGHTFVQTITLASAISAGIQIGGQASASCLDNATGLIHFATGTVAHLDGVCAASTGLGGQAQSFSGGGPVISNQGL